MSDLTNRLDDIKREFLVSRDWKLADTVADAIAEIERLQTENAALKIIDRSHDYDDINGKEVLAQG